MSMYDDIKEVLVNEEQLKECVQKLGAQITKDYEGKNLLLVSVLRGSVIFMADLMGKLLADYVASYKDSVTVDESLIAGVDIKSAGINLHY